MFAFGATSCKINAEKEGTPRRRERGEENDHLENIFDTKKPYASI
jgi:hypothetical protein